MKNLTVLVLSLLAGVSSPLMVMAQTPAVAASAASAPAALAVKLDPEKSPRYPWQALPPRATADAYFTNLKDGDKIETPFRATFGLSGGWGLAPIAKPMNGRNGHHHLLVNRELPLDFKQALPFDERYIHFGKGQMETVLNFPPGTYNLRLLLADDQHLPHYVYSKPLHITVTRKRDDVDPKTLVQKGVALLNLTDGQRVKPPFRVQFHASGLNIGNSVQKEAGTGHFRLTVTPQTGKPVEMLFPNGETETWLAPPAGAYILKLDLVDNVNPSALLSEAQPLTLRVD